MHAWAGGMREKRPVAQMLGLACPGFMKRRDAARSLGGLWDEGIGREWIQYLCDETGSL